MDEHSSALEKGLQVLSPDADDAGSTDANLVPAAGIQGGSGATEQQKTAAAQHQEKQQQPNTSSESAAASGAASAEHAKVLTDTAAATSSIPAAKQHTDDAIVDSVAGTGEAALAAGALITAAAEAKTARSKAAAPPAGDAVADKQQASPSAKAATGPEQAESVVAGAGQSLAASSSPEQQLATEDQPSAAVDPAANSPAAAEAPAALSSSAAEHHTDAAIHPPTESSPSPPAGAHPAAAKLAAAKKSTAAKKKPAQVSVTGGSGGGGGGAAAAAGSPAAVPSTHGSNPARKGLHTLFGEASTLSVLSQEGSEMPGSRPPAQLHAALDGHDHGPIGETLTDDEEQQEIQKIISEIHGNGDDSDGDESQDDRLADIKHQHLAPHADASQHVPGDEGSTAAGGAVPSSLTLPQQQTANDLLVYEQSGLSPGAAGASVGPDVESSEAMPAEDMHSPQQHHGRGSPSPWPGVTQIQHELLDPDTSVEPTPAGHTTAAEPLGQHTGSLRHHLPADESTGDNPEGYDPNSYADSAAVADEGSMGPGPEGLTDDQAEGLSQGLGEGDGSYEGGGGDEEQRSRAIAEQLAQLHEESRRLHLQSQLLQHQAIEMSLQMATSASLSNNNSPAADPHISSHQSTHHISNIGAHPNVTQQDQQAMSYDPAAGSSHSSNGGLGLGFSQAVTPGGVPLNPETLGLVEGAGPRHPPGDSTPISVTSSRAGLNWNIPSRGGIPSPGKVGSMSPALPGSPNLRNADARSNFDTIAQGLALHADPSLDYQMYTYHKDSNNSSHVHPISNSAAAADYGYQPPLPQQQRQQQQPMQELYGHYQQQQHRQEHAHEHDLYQQPQHQMISTQQQHQQQSHQRQLDKQQHHDAGHAQSMDHKAAETAAQGPPSPTAAASGHGGRAYRSQRSLRGSKSGQTQPQKPAEPPLVVRKPTLPVKQGSGASTRVAAAGATAGRRLSSDNVTSYYSMADETPVVGTFNAAHAVVGAQGTVTKAKQQQQTAGRLSPRTSLAAAGGGGKAAAAGTAATSSSAAAAAAAAATSKLAGSSHKPVAAVARSRSTEMSPDHGPSAAALAAAAAAATSSSGGYPQQNRQRMHPPPPPPPAGPWGSGPVNPYAAAAMYGGGYAAVNPGLVPMMMQNPMQATGNANSTKKGLGGKISPGRAAGGNNMSHPESLPAMTAAMPPGAMWMPVGLPPGFMPVMPPGHMSGSGGKGGLVPPGNNPARIAAGRGIGGSNSAPAGVQYGLPGMPPAQFMPMPGMPGQMGYPRMAFAPNPFPMSPQQAAMAAAAGGGKGGAVGKFPALGHNAAQQGGGIRAGKGPVPAGLPPGYMPAPPGGYGMPAAAAAGYPAASGAWGPMMGPPGQFGMMPMYAAAPGVMAGYQQQQGVKGGKGGAGGKGGWQS